MESAEQIIRMNNLSKELRKYGFAQCSQEAIAQAGSIVGNGNSDITSPQPSDTAQLSRAQLNELLNKMQRLWTFKETTDQKVSVIAEQLVKVTDKLNEVIKSLSLVEMNQAVFDKKLNILREGMGNDHPRHHESRHTHQEHGTESSAREREVEKRLDRPIDRNGVAPSSVSIEKMFYCGNKR
jgi:DNA repair exonuclease SbcCD ATPase subunit